MASSVALPALEDQIEDPLAYLPHSEVVEYAKGRTIYEPNQCSTELYLVIEGKVKVSRLAHRRREVVIDIYGADELFGESAFLNLSRRREGARTLENTKLMMWQTSALQEIVASRPKLAVAFLQIIVQRASAFKERIESLSVDSVGRRVASSLIRLSERLGTPEGDGSVSMVPLTHELLAQYVGTTREIVTHYMNQFRRQGYLCYSRKGITVYRDAFNEWLRQT